MNFLSKLGLNDPWKIAGVVIVVILAVWFVLPVANKYRPGQSAS